MIYTKDNQFIIKSVTHDQIEKLRELRNSPDTWKFLSNPFEINEMEQERWFEQMSLDATKQYFAIITDNQLIGCVWYDEWDRVNSSCRIGLFIDMASQCGGVGTRVLDAFLTYLQKDMNIHRVWLLVLKENAIAIHLYKKLKFVKEGVQRQAIFRDGKYHDYLMMARIR